MADRLEGAEVLSRGPGSTGVRPAVETIRRLTRYVRDWRPDIVQTNGSLSSRYGLLAALLHRRTFRSVRIVERVIDDPIYWADGRRLAPALRRHVLRQVVDARVGVSRQALANAEALYGPVPIQEYIPRGVAMDRLEVREGRDEIRARLGEPSDAPVVLWVGRYTEQKRPDRVLRVFRRVREGRPDARLWMLGGGEGLDATRRAAEEDGLGGAVSFFGPTDEVGPFYAAADVLLLPSDSEGIPGVLLEAMALGRACVASAVGGVPDVCRGRLGDFVHPPAAEESMAEGVARLLDDPELRASMGRLGRERVLRDFTVDGMVARYEALYRRVWNGAA